ncbi:hypothetical protein BGZ72_001145 [Mortierella alpina]|nr:hypothetical protein BGZ72_001145 [Mortierella alpina]
MSHAFTRRSLQRSGGHSSHSSHSSLLSWATQPAHGKRLDLSLLFLLWLCITLSLSSSTAQGQGQVAPPNGYGVWTDFDQYFAGTECTVHGGQCCSNSSAIPCQGWFCIERTCSVLACEYCSDDPQWFCGQVEGVTKNHGLACKYRATENQTCDNKTMPCQPQMYCSANNNTCQMTPERKQEVEEESKSRRITMAGMIVVLIGMFVAMRRMLKNEEARRRQIWEPVDSSAEASILRRLAEDTQRRVAGGWGQISGSLVEGGNAATTAVGTAFSRIRNNVMNATGANSRAVDDCDDDSVEMLPNGRRAQTRRELEADMRDFLLEGDDDENDDDEDDHVRDEDGLLARHRSTSSSYNSSQAHSSGSNTHSPPSSDNNIITIAPAVSSLQAAGINNHAEGFPDEPPAYDEIRTNGQGPPSLIAGLSSTSTTSTAATPTPTRGTDTNV